MTPSLVLAPSRAHTVLGEDLSSDLAHGPQFGADTGIGPGGLLEEVAMPDFSVGAFGSELEDRWAAG